MKHNLIKTDNYLFAVDDKDFNAGSKVLHKESIYIVKEDTGSYLKLEEFSHIGIRKDLCKKILSHRPLNGAPYLDGVDVLPLLNQEDDIEKLFNNCWIGKKVDYNTDNGTSFKEGYNIAREKYKFTEEDLKRAIDIYKSSIGVDNDGESCYSHLSTEQIIQSLQQPKLLIWFECEKERVENNDVVFEDGSFNKPPYRYVPKTIINSESRTEWVGKYIYE